MRRRLRTHLVASFIVLLLGLSGGPISVLAPDAAFAQSKKKTTQKAKKPSETKTATKKPALKPPGPVSRRLLIQSTLLALHHANLTGNYSVVRDLGVPAFIASNSVARLSEAFKPFRNANLNITPILLQEPVLDKRSKLDGRGLLRLAGYMPTKPVRIDFDLTYRMLDGRWRLYSLSANPTRIDAEAKTGTPPPAKKNTKADEKPAGLNFGQGVQNGWQPK